MGFLNLRACVRIGVAATVALFGVQPHISRASSTVSPPYTSKNTFTFCDMALQESCQTKSAVNVQNGKMKLAATAIGVRQCTGEDSCRVDVGGAQAEAKLGVLHSITEAAARITYVTTMTIERQAHVYVPYGAVSDTTAELRASFVHTGEDIHCHADHLEILGIDNPNDVLITRPIDNARRQVELLVDLRCKQGHGTDTIDIDVPAGIEVLIEIGVRTLAQIHANNASELNSLQAGFAHAAIEISRISTVAEPIPAA